LVSGVVANMQNQDLAKDDIKRAEIRLGAIEVLLYTGNWSESCENRRSRLN